MKIAFPFLSDKVGLKYISHTIFFCLAASSRIRRSNPSPTSEFGLSADFASNVDQLVVSIYISLYDARLVAMFLEGSGL